MEAVWIKMPVVLQPGYIGMLSSRTVKVLDDYGRTLWEGRQGTIASFDISSPIKIKIDLGSFANEVSGVVRPGGKYVLMVDNGIHWKSQYILSEVDMLVG